MASEDSWKLERSVLSLKGSVGQALMAFDRIEREALTIDLRRKAFGWGALILLIPTTLRACAAFSERPDASDWPWAVVAFLGFVFWRRYRYYAGRRLDPRKAGVVQQLLTTLGPECLDGAPLALTLDSRPYDSSKEIDAPGPGQSRWNHPWLELTLVLEDGTTVQLTGSTFVALKKKVKRKWTKLRETYRERLSITLIAPKGQPLPAGLGERLSLGDPCKDMRFLSAKVSPKRATMRFETLLDRRQNSRYSALGPVRSGAQLTGAKVVAALVASYKALGHAIAREASGV